MVEIRLNIPGEILLALKTSPEEIGEFLLISAAVKLYEMGRLSSGLAAHLAGVPRVVFLTRLADYHAKAFDLTEEQIQRDMTSFDTKQKPDIV
jgi:predicted HTH domain antitoxin